MSDLSPLARAKRRLLGPLALGVAVFAFVEMLYLTWFLPLHGAGDFVPFGWAVFLVFVLVAVTKTLPQRVRSVTFIVAVGAPLLPSLLISGISIINVTNVVSLLLMVALLTDRRWVSITLGVVFALLVGTSGLHMALEDPVMFPVNANDPLTFVWVLLHFSAGILSPIIGITMLPRLVWEELSLEYHKELSATAAAAERQKAPTEPWTEIRLWATDQGSETVDPSIGS